MPDSTRQPPSLEALTDGWIAAERLPPDERLEPAAIRAIDAVNQRIQNGSAGDGWALVQLLLARACGADPHLSALGAGPLEDFLHAHATARIDEIEAAAADDDDLRYAFSRVWISEGEVPPDILARLIAASEGRMKVFPAHTLHGDDEDPPGPAAPR